jgi:divalent metal cation (Fe/Co/Zn/Cd) transporter
VRPARVRAAIRWCAASVAWAALVGAATLAVGAATRSTALIGFGVNSIVDGAASAVLVYRFRWEQRGAGTAEALDARAARIVGTILIAIGLSIGAGAAIQLSRHARPHPTTVGTALAAASMVVLPILGTAKLRLARRLGSPGLRADAILSIAGAALALTTLASTTLEHRPSLWWTDPVAALIIAAALISQGVDTRRGAAAPATERHRSA